MGAHHTGVPMAVIYVLKSGDDGEKRIGGRFSGEFDGERETGRQTDIFMKGEKGGKEKRRERGMHTYAQR